jgi:dsRNA-specific ribonuclease
MLSSVIAAHLFNKAPHGDEGYLTKMRSKIVSREHLNELGKDLNLFYRVKYLYNILRKHTWQYFLNLDRCHLSDRGISIAKNLFKKESLSL